MAAMALLLLGSSATCKDGFSGAVDGFRRMRPGPNLLQLDLTALMSEDQLHPFHEVLPKA